VVVFFYLFFSFTSFSMSFLHCIIGIVEHMNPLSMRSYA